MPIKAKPFFSIIIPCLNEEHFVPFLLEDLQQQSYQDFEVIVVDGQSDDKTQQKVKEFPGVKLIVAHKRNAAFQRNLGATQAKGEFLLFLDADIRIEPNFVPSLINHIKKHKIICGGTISKPIEVNMIGKPNIIDRALFTVWNYWMIILQNISPQASGNCIFCRKVEHDKLGGFNSKIMLGEDIAYAKKAAKLGKFCILPTSIYISTSVRRYRTQGYFNYLFNVIKYCLQAIFRFNKNHDTVEYAFGNHKIRN